MDDDFLEMQYEDSNGNLFDEGWQAEEFSTEDIRNLVDAYWDDLLESDI